MKYRSVRRLFLFALGTIVALGISTSTIASGDLATRSIPTTAVIDDMAMSDCEDSGKGQPCKPDMPCAAICAGPVLSLPPSIALLEQADLELDFANSAAKPLLGSSAPPELSPPRTTYMV